MSFKGTSPGNEPPPDAACQNDADATDGASLHDIMSIGWGIGHNRLQPEPPMRLGVSCPNPSTGPPVEALITDRWMGEPTFVRKLGREIGDESGVVLQHTTGNTTGVVVPPKGYLSFEAALQSPHQGGSSSIKRYNAALVAIRGLCDRRRDRPDDLDDPFPAIRDKIRKRPSTLLVVARDHMGEAHLHSLSEKRIDSTNAPLKRIWSLGHSVRDLRNMPMKAHERMTQSGLRKLPGLSLRMHCIGL